MPVVPTCWVKRSLSYNVNESLGLIINSAIINPTTDDTPRPMAPPSGVQFETMTATTAKTTAGIKSLLPYLADPFSASLSVTSIIFLILLV